MTRFRFTIVTACALFVGAGLHAQRGHAQGLDSRVTRGMDIAPVPLNLSGLNPALVGTGSYIVNAQGACTDCHTAPPYAPGGNPFLGEAEAANVSAYLAGGAAFDPFTSRNLTPNGAGRPAGLTLDQFMAVMHTGVDIKNAHPSLGPLLQVMPWPVYRKMSDFELRAIYEYLRAIPCIATPTRPTRCNPQ